MGSETGTRGLAAEIIYRVISSVRRGALSGVSTSWELLKVMIPTMVVVQILKVTGLLGKMAAVGAPLMDLFGLPGESSLVLITGGLVNIYAAIAVAVNIPLTAKGMTILGIMVLIAHNLIVDYYVDIPEKSSSFTNIISIDVTDPSSDVYAEVYLLGNGNLVYVSENNIYVTNPVSWYDYTQLENLLDDLVMPLLPDSLNTELDLVEQLSLDDYQKNTITQWILQNYVENLTTLQKEQLAEQVVEQLERTIIHRISIKNGDITYESQGSVPGSILNQFSLSEYQGNLRVSTTINGWMVRSYLADFQERNNIYVLNEDLDIIGSLTGLAEGETIFSTRFVNDLCYLVTFEQIDPFFVIDLATPTNPQVLGELKIPGFSTYLHPYDDTHIIGIGRDEQQVKITLFDVTNLNNPLELDTYAINKTSQEEWIWTQSSALYEHKAFLFSKAKNLLVIPVGTYQKESAYIFNISINDGITLNGIVTHDHQIEIEEPKEPWESSYYYGDWGNSIKRTLYIENSLYTISDNMIKINDLTTLTELNSILLV